MSFREIDAVLWESMEPSLPPQKSHTGRPRANMRKCFQDMKLKKHHI